MSKFLFSLLKLFILLNFFSSHETSLCFDQLEFLTGASYCFEMASTPQGKPDEHALWPLYGSSNFAMRLEMVDSITFRTELDISGKLFSRHWFLFGT